MTVRRKLLVLLAAAVMTASAPAFGALAQPSVVRADPADFTPHVEGGAERPAVHALAQRGRTIYAGGAFSVVADSGRNRSVSRENLVSFDAVTGAIRGLAPNVGGAVYALRPAGRWLYVGGDFARVNGVQRRGIARINATTGAVDPGFNARLDGRVTEIRLVGTRLLVGGSFTQRLLALNPQTGAHTRYIGVRIAGSRGEAGTRGNVYRFAVNAARTRLVAVGNFRTVAGRSRNQAFMLNLGRRSTTLNGWHYQPLTNLCRSDTKRDYLRDVDFAPDGRYFVLVSTGGPPRAGGLGRDICDATARFETRIAAPRRPTWMNYTGGDTLHSVAATGSAVYVQGHQRQLNAPVFAAGVRDRAIPVDRAGIGAINPRTGRALTWNPGKTRGIGGKDFLATRAGLWVGSDGVRFAGEVHQGIAFCPR
ncbi:MAG: hypothetical protein ACRDO0_09965 [Nocardioidaceae bacterium]